MSTKQYKPHGKIDYTNAGAAISPNAIVAIGRYVGMALNDIAASTGLGPVAVMDIVQVTKTAGTAWTQGLEIFWDAGASSFTTVPTGNTFAGFAAEAATSGATTGYLDLCPCPNTFVSPKVVTALLDLNGNELLKVTATGSAVNEITITNNSTGQVPTISSSGEANIGLTVMALGTGTLTLGRATGKVQIGTVGTDYVGFYGTTPAQQPAHVADPAAMAAQTSAALTVTDGAGTNDGTIPAITTGGASADQSAVIAAIQELADQINKLVVDLAAAKTAVDANNAAIDSINAVCATLGVTAAS